MITDVEKLRMAAIVKQLKEQVDIAVEAEIKLFAAEIKIQKLEQIIKAMGDGIDGYRETNKQKEVL